MDSSDQNKKNSTGSSTVLKSPSRTISVHSIGESRCPPSVIQFGVSVSSSKDCIEAALASVKRRIDYIIQVLHNNGIKDRSYNSSTDISRSGDSAHVQTSVLVQCETLGKCETVRNLLIEKLDASSVQFSPVTFHHVFEDQELKRQESFQKAVGNARSKAQSVSQTVGVQLGPALEVVELSQDAIQGLYSNSSDLNSSQSELFPNNPHLQQARETIVYRSQVSIIFETQPIQNFSNKGSKKH